MEEMALAWPCWWGGTVNRNAEQGLVGLAMCTVFRGSSHRILPIAPPRLDCCDYTVAQ